jgi:DNA-binding SARP family transcriptional activator/Tfp pilus assembly protein PilF
VERYQIVTSSLHDPMQDLPAAAVEIRALGARLVIGPGRGPLDVTQPKRLALLFFLALAVPRSLQRRDTLLAMFWPEADRATAGQSLRQALHYLRALLPPDLLVTRGSSEIGLDHKRVRCDAALFDAMLDDGREEEALPLYRGDLLPGFHVPTAPDFERWLEMERTRLRLRVVRAALVVAHRRADANDLAAAAEQARVAVQYADGDEVVLHEVVHLLDGAGGRSHALRLGEWGVERMRTELEVEPAAETVELITRLRGDVVSLHTPSWPMRARSVGGSGGGSAAVARGGSRVSPPRPRPMRPGIEAYHAYVRGLHHDEQRTPASLRCAIQHYEQAVRLDPKFALAHLGLARAWGILPSYSAAPATDAYPLAKHHASKALALDPSLTEAYAWLAHALLCHEWDWLGAEHLLRQAVEQDATAPYPHIVLAMYLLPSLGRMDEAIAEIELARQLEPASLPVNTYVGLVSFYGRRYARAVEEARLVLEMNPRFPLALSVLGMALEQMGEHSEAIAALERAVEVTGSGPLMRVQLGRALAVAGERARARSILGEVVGTASESQLPHVFLAGAYAALGECAAALEWLHRAYRERSPLLVHIGVTPTLDPLRTERRFRELLLRVGLPGALQKRVS